MAGDACIFIGQLTMTGSLRLANLQVQDGVHNESGIP